MQEMKHAIKAAFFDMGAWKALEHLQNTVPE
jgi:hypothetical protein